MAGWHGMTRYTMIAFQPVADASRQSPVEHWTWILSRRGQTLLNPLHSQVTEDLPQLAALENSLKLFWLHWHYRDLFFPGRSFTEGAHTCPSDNGEQNLPLLSEINKLCGLWLKFSKREKSCWQKSNYPENTHRLGQLKVQLYLGMVEAWSNIPVWVWTWTPRNAPT